MMEQNEIFTEEVKAFFNKPELYLKNEFGRQIRREILREMLAGHQFDTMVDIGCGDGSLSLDFLGKCSHITLVDISESMLSLAKARLEGQNRLHTSLEYVEGNFCKEKLPLKKYGLVLCIGVLAHVENLQEAFRTLFSLVQDDGRITLQFSDLRSWMTRLQMATHRKNYSLNHLKLSEIMAICQSSGFELEQKQQFGFFLPGIGKLPGKLVYRMQRAFYKSRIWSRFGADFILVLRKKSVSK